MTRRPVTETPNELTKDIDIATPEAIVRYLRSTDYQIFGGYGGYPGLYDAEVLHLLAALAEEAARILSNPKGCVVLSGAGTSGRLAMFTARSFNKLLGTPERPRPFRYTMAGTELALIAAQEKAEDNPQQGVADLIEAAAGAEEVFYVGITCGLSAPYIAGQIDYFLEGKQDGHAVLLGFNPREMARNVPIEGWDKTFMDVLTRMEDSEIATILNPIVGPEPITGSTRMKSGSATKIVLEVLFHAARAIDVESLDDEDADARLNGLMYVIRVLLSDFENAVREAYTPLHEIAELVRVGGDTLSNGGRIFYLGATGPEAIEGGGCHDHNCDEDHDHITLATEGGIIGLVDASECPPTYGASFDDVRGYLYGGWDALLGGGKNLSDRGENYRIDLEDFRADKLSTLSGKDLVVFLGQFPGRDELVEEVHGKGARTAAINLAQADNAPATEISIELAPNLSTINTDDEDDSPEFFEGPAQLSFKLVLNALTTGAHILAGKVYGNRMVDLKISNNKLFFRTVGIISDLIGVSEEDATAALLKAVYETDDLTAEQKDGAIQDHIERSKSVEKVVPKALLLATKRFDYKQAAEALKENPIVRTAISEFAK